MPPLKKKPLLADKINTLLSAAPTNFDSDDEAEDTKAKVVEPHNESDANSDDDFRQSRIRKQNVQLLDEIDSRYKGKKVSRKDVYREDEDSDLTEDSEENHIEKGEESDDDMENESDSIEGEEELDDDMENELDSMEEEEDDDDDNENEELSSVEDEEDAKELEDEVDRENPFYKERNRSLNFKTISTTNVRGEIEKGNCVRSQLKLWESLLEMRIKLQKCLLTGNQMPQYDVHKKFRVNGEFMKKTNDTKNKLMLLLNNMLDFQTILLKQFPETKNLDTQNKNKKDDENVDDNEGDNMDEEISDIEDEIENEERMENEKEEGEEENEENKEQKSNKRRKFTDYEKELQKRHKMYSSYRDSVISKWNDKTRIASGNIHKSGNQTTLKQIEFALNDKLKLHKRTQLKRSDYIIVGKSLENDNEERRTQEYDTEIYDDDDFYHQLLRDLIEHKSSDVTDPIQLSKQWIKLQNMRSKMKRKIDTRATKGRRVRYNVHTKLVNFMAPITVHDTWTDTAKNELYNSLFGKIKTTEEVDH